MLKKRKNAKKEAALEQIAKEIESCKICKLGKIGKAVPGEGSADADIVFLGEAPGKKEAETGRPFIGRAGKLLRSLLEQNGIDSEDVFITSPVKYLPEYVTPKPADIEHGRVHLKKQLSVIQPKVVVLMGNTAIKAMLGGENLQEAIPISITRDHGKVVEKDGVRYFISYHPAAPLYSPKLRTEIEEDFRKLSKLIKQ